MRIVRYYPRALIGDGGMTNAVRKWSQGMANAGAEMVVAFDEGVRPPVSDEVTWTQVSHAGRPRLKFPMGLADVLRGSDLLVLHSGWTLHNVRAAMVARKLGVPYVLEPRGAYDPHIVRRKPLLKKAWWLAWERRLVMSSRAIHLFFEPERAHLGAIGYKGPVIVASNGVEAPEAASWDGGSGDYVLWLGRFDPEHKGLDVLLEGMALIPPANRPQLRLLGPEWRARKSRVSQMAADLALTRWVTVGEPVYGEAKREMLLGAKAFVYPSRWDACPNSVLESVSMGLPTLVTPYPLGEYLATKRGAVLAPGTPTGLADGLQRVCSPSASETGAIGARIVRQELTWNQVARTWLEQARELM